MIRFVELFWKESVSREGASLSDILECPDKDTSLGWNEVIL